MNRQFSAMKGLVAVACTVGAVGMAKADCSNLTVSSAISSDPDAVQRIQSGLTSALDDLDANDSRLSDGVIGAETRAALSQLCQTIVLPSDDETSQATVALAEDYGRLAMADPNWRSRVGSEDFVATLTPDPETGLMLKTLALATSPAAGLTVLATSPSPNDCTSLTAIAATGFAEEGLLALEDADPEAFVDPVAICAAFPGFSDSDAYTAFLTSIGTLEDRLTDSVADLLSPEFTAWLAEEADTRMRRLVGSDPAVVALVSEYRDDDHSTAPRDFSNLYKELPDSCAPAQTIPTSQFTAFSTDDLASLAEAVDVAGPLSGLAGTLFSTRAELVEAIEEAVGNLVDQCTLDQIKSAVTNSEDFGREFSLDPEGAPNLAVRPGFSDTSAEAIAPFIGLTSQTRGALLSGLRRAIRTSAATAVDAEIALAADTMAAAAEVVLAVVDTRPEDVPEFPAPDAPPPLGVTENTDSALIATVENEAFRDALLAAQYQPAPNAEVLKGDVRRILGPIAQDQVDAVVRRDMPRVRSVIVDTWSLTDDLSTAIFLAPGVKAAASANVSETLAERLNQLPGVSYPTPELFQAAVAASGTEDEPMPPELAANALRLAESAAPVPDQPRTAAGMALPGCGCVVPRRENGETYAFYPFWNLALADTPDADDSDADGAEAEGDPVTPVQIDFSDANRVAFYGMEFFLDASEDDTNRIIRLSHAAQWLSTRRVFTDTAHRHRSMVDVAFTLRDWQDWTDPQIRGVADRIATLTAPYSRFDITQISEVRAALPALLSPGRPDGVTLVVGGYDGTNPADLPSGKLLLLIDTLARELRPRGQEITLAFDLRLADVADTEPLFSDLRSVLVEDEAGEATVTRLLVFLERPTTDTKKTLRARMENGDFRGIERTNVLRRIYPIVPNAGHANVLQSQRSSTGAADSPPLFSQFTDDLVYFRDNFGGMGFWPALDPNGEETPDLVERLSDQLYAPEVPTWLGPLSAQVLEQCTIVCPNRVYFSAFAATIALGTGLLILRSFFTGRADKLAFRVGFAWMGLGTLFLTLLTMTVCDKAAIVPEIGLWALILSIALLLVYNAYNRARNGPKP